MQEKEKPNGFVFLPRWFWESSQIDSKDRSLCITLAYHRNQQTKLCCPRRSKLRKEAGLSQVVYYKVREKLQKLGLISFESNSGGRKKSVRFKLNWLDGSKEEIERLRKVLEAKKPYQNQSGFNTKNRTKINQANRTKINQANRTKINQRTIKNYNNNKYQQQRKKSLVAVSSSSEEGKPKKQIPPAQLIDLIVPMFKDKDWDTLERETIIELIQIAIKKGKTDIPNYFRYWKKAIDAKPRSTNKPGYLIKMIKQGNDPPKYENEQNYRPL